VGKFKISHGMVTADVYKATDEG